jgi:hypothetical protein
MLKLRRLAAHWKVLVISVAVIVAVLAVALPIGLIGGQGAAGSIQARSDRVGTAAPATAGHHAARRAAHRVGCLVRYTPTTWPGSFLAQVTISNHGKTDIHGWTLTFRFPGNEAISSAWNATFTQNGTEVSAKNMNFDAVIRQGASQSLGFLGAQRSSGTAPASFRLNGTPCS